MTSRDDDDRLLREVDEAVRAEVTERARRAARGAFAWRTVDDELLRLVRDSADATLPADLQVRSLGAAPRVVGYEGPGLTLEVEVDDHGLTGQVLPPRECRVVVVAPDREPVELATDSSGVFVTDSPGPGPVRVTVVDAGRRCTTPWLPL